MILWTSRSRVLQLAVPGGVGDRGGWWPVIDVGSPWLRHADEVRDGECSVCVRVSHERGLHVLDRPWGSVLPNTYPSGIPAISLVLCHRACLPVPCPVFRPVHGPARVHQNFHSGSEMDTPQGRVPSSLPGRLSGHSRVEDPSAAASGCGSPVVQGSGDRCQLGEVRLPIVHLCPVSGVAGRHVSRGGVPVGSSYGSLSGNGGFFSHIYVVRSTHLAAGVGPHGFA